MTKDEKGLEILKREFSSLQKKYNLPNFEQLNIHFDIERAAEKETDLLLREIRRTMADKIYLYLKFCEMILNPSSGAPMFMFSLLKNLTANDKKKIEELYKRLGQLDIEIMTLDLEYSEKKEAEFIKNINEEWKSFNKDLLATIALFKDSGEKSPDKNNKGYFG